MSALCLGVALIASPVVVHAQATTVSTPINKDANVGIAEDGPKFEDLQNDATRDFRQQQRQENRSARRELRRDQENQLNSVQTQQDQETQAGQAMRDIENAQRDRELEKAHDKQRNSFDNAMLLRDTVDILTRATGQVMQNQMYYQGRAQDDAAAARAQQDYDNTTEQILEQQRQAQDKVYEQSLQEQQDDVETFKDMQEQDAANKNSVFSDPEGKANEQSIQQGNRSYLSAQKTEHQKDMSALGDRTKAAGALNNQDTVKADSIGVAIANFGKNITNAPSLFYILSYVCGVYFMALGLLKANKAAMEPGRNPVSDAAKFMVAGVLLCALPLTSQMLKNSFGFDGTGTFDLIYTKGLTADGKATAAGQGLDKFMVSLVKDITKPMLGVIALVCYASGVFLLFVGLQRLVKGSDQGPKGPAGLGTLMTFIVASALISFAPTVQLVLNTVFGSNADVATYPNMTTLAGQIGTDPVNMAQAQAVVTALLAFLTIFGLISFARGLFMLKDAADGAQNASLMGSISHMIAGVCCVNFGVFANMLQKTLSLTGIGITFE